MFGEQAVKIHVQKGSPLAALQGCEHPAVSGSVRNVVARDPRFERQYLMDKLDKKILEQLQKNAGLTAAELADQIGLSKAPCWRRIKRLEEEGVIK